ncbi:MAG: segregation/condensation protein A [Phycisphaeraceae bacterium]|nr:MAG: segregation/condensation protein A [Phycisphaeraceae bacterium]
MTVEYRVQLDAFEGPLDLLLYLIRRAEVEITDIPVATITDQYIEYLENIDRVDIDLAGEFLVMAATLTELKSRVVGAIGRPEGGRGEAARPEDDTDPRAELIRQLLEYKKYRDAADALERRREQWEARFPVAPAGVSAEELREAFESMDDPELEDLNLLDLFEAFQKIASSVDMTRLGEHEVLSDETPIELHAEDIMDRVRREHEKGGQLSLFGVMHGRTRAEMVGLFLALLDLVRQRRLGFRQSQDEDGTTGEIVLEAREDTIGGTTADDAGEGL